MYIYIYYSIHICFHPVASVIGIVRRLRPIPSRMIGMVRSTCRTTLQPKAMAAFHNNWRSIY